VDQGWAAVLAAVVGLVGALGGAVAGGYAAIRGAREGAERSARAALEQAARQAQDQHEYWLRQERRAAYTDMLHDADAIVMKMADLVKCLENEYEEVSTLTAVRDTLASHVLLIQRISHVVTVAGPGVWRALQAFELECRQTCRSLIGRGADLSTCEVRSRYEAMSRKKADLTLSIAREIQTGPAGVRSAEEPDSTSGIHQRR